MLPSLASLIALQSLDTAAESARKRLADMPAAEQAIDARIAASAAAVESAGAGLHESQQARRQLEKDVAVIDARLARFGEHQAAVKTNQEYQALTHEIATAKTDKDTLEERILVLMEDADTLAVAAKAAEAALASTRRDGEAMRAGLAADRAGIEADLARLTASRAVQAAATEPRALALYDQLLKGRRGIAVARMINGICGACHVRLRPHIDQQIRRNDSIVQCESCQRILHFEHPSAGAQAAPSDDAQAPGDSR